VIYTITMVHSSTEYNREYMRNRTPDQRAYHERKTLCETCECYVNRDKLQRHYKTKKHEFNKLKQHTEKPTAIEDVFEVCKIAPTKVIGCRNKDIINKYKGGPFICEYFEGGMIFFDSVKSKETYKANNFLY
jgi:hypothetical protein